MMIREYRILPVAEKVDDGKQPDLTVWKSRRAVDLRCVASAAVFYPYEIPNAFRPSDEPCGTWVWLAGIPRCFEIDEDFDRFVRDWQSV